MQEPAAVNVTGRPDDAVAETVKSGAPYVTSASGPNEIVCDAFTTVWLLCA